MKQGLHLVTGIKKTMENKLMPLQDKILNDLKGFYSNQALKNTENEQVPHLIEQIGSGSFKFGNFVLRHENEVLRFKK